MAADEGSSATKFPKGKRLGDWVIVKKLGEGGFGQVYKVENRTTKKFAALKAEPNDIEGGSAIKLELTVLKALTEKGDRAHIPTAYHSGRHKKYSYVVMTLLGENLKYLRLSCHKELMTAQSWSRIGIQCLYSVKLLHDYGFIHRDIKPQNFVVGHSSDTDRARIVHILDFGMARPFAYVKHGEWTARRARGSAAFRGTLSYCSPNVHNKKEHGRHDDLWALFYVLMEMHCELPWHWVKNKEKVESTKMNIADKALVQNFPVELHDIVPYLRTLDCYQRPDYNMFHTGLVSIMRRLGVKPSDPYDWEKKDSIITSKAADWENSEEFFRSDPIGIHAPPKK